MRREALTMTRGLAVVVAALAGPSARATATRDTPATTMYDLRGHFAACLTPPAAAGSRLTFYFSLDRRGGVFGRPRTLWLGFKGSEAERRRAIPRFESAFEKCLPLNLSPSLAATIPGKVYYLQYVVDAGGRESAVLLRPFGSHSGVGGAGPMGGGSVGPLEPEPFVPTARPAFASPIARRLGIVPFARTPFIALPARRGRFARRR